jgi:hypothetical protein
MLIGLLSQEGLLVGLQSCHRSESPAAQLHSPFLRIITHHHGILEFDSGTSYRSARMLPYSKDEYQKDNTNAISEIGLNQRNQSQIDD